MTDIDTATRIAVESVRAVTDTLNPLLAEKDALIASQARRIAELEKGLEETADALESKLPISEVKRSTRPPYEHPVSVLDRARALLNRGEG